jgi:hypothetical protein
MSSSFSPGLDSSTLRHAVNARTAGDTRSRKRPTLSLDAAYVRALETLEALPQNQTGVDKSWVEHTLRSWREVCRRAVRVR